MDALLTASPRRTIATAQTLYMRFHLFFPYADFNYVVSPLPFYFVLFRPPALFCLPSDTSCTGSSPHDAIRRLEAARHAQEAARHYPCVVFPPLPAPGPPRRPCRRHGRGPQHAGTRAPARALDRAARPRDHVLCVPRRRAVPARRQARAQARPGQGRDAGRMARSRRLVSAVTVARRRRS